MRCLAWDGGRINHLMLLMMSRLQYFIVRWWLSFYLISLRMCSSYFPWAWSSGIVVAKGPGNLPAFRVWTTKTGWFSSRPGEKPDPLTLGWHNLDPFRSSSGSRRVWLDPSVPISCSAFWVSHLWLYWDTRLVIITYWHSYITVYFQRFGRPNGPNEQTHAPYHILKMSINWAWTILGLAYLVIWVALDLKHP